MKYTKKERLVAVFLSKFPKIKKKVKLIYQKINHFYYKKEYKIKISNKYKYTEITYRKDESFFGYYDKSPINITNEYIIFLSSNYSTQTLPNPNFNLDLVLFDLKKNKKTVIDQVYSYNWQQGCKMMWINDYSFIYNDFCNKENRYISKIYDVKNKISKQFNYPIYDVYKEDYALSLNFDRLLKLRPDYGYRNKKNINLLNHNNDGVFFVDLKTNSFKVLITINRLIKLTNKKSMKGASHKFNHIMISPNGKKFMFLHRWFVGDRKFDRLIVSDIEGKEIECISDDDMVSHCFWFDNEIIIGFLRDFSKGDQYYSINIKTKKKKVLGNDFLKTLGDGHPNINRSKMIIDTYPNKARMKELFIFDFQNKEIEKVGEFYESFKFNGETRCDLHPRFSFTGDRIFVDSVHDNKRRLIMIEKS